MGVKDRLRGIYTSPALTALLRGLVEAIALAALVYVGEAASAGQLPDGLQVYAPLLLLGVRQLEGVADQIDPAKRRRRQAADEETRLERLRDRRPRRAKRRVRSPFPPPRD